MNERGDELQGRLDRVGRVAPLPLLALGTLMAWVSVRHGYGDWRRFDHGLIVVATAALWTGLVTIRTAQRTGPAAAVGFVGHTVLAGVLVGVNPWFGVFAITGYAMVDCLRQRAVTVGLLATASVLAASQAGSWPFGHSAADWFGYLIVFGINGTLVLAFVEVTNRLTLQNLDRGRMIVQLNESNAQLESAIAENAGLHAQLVEQAREAGVQEVPGCPGGPDQRVQTCSCLEGLAHPDLPRRRRAARRPRRRGGVSPQPERRLRAGLDAPATGARGRPARDRVRTRRRHRHQRLDPLRRRMIRLLIVDDHPVVRDGLRGVFAGEEEFSVVGEAANGLEALALVARGDVDVVLMDLRMPTMGGVETTALLKERHPGVRVLVLTTYDTDRDVMPAIEAGATGYLLKDAPRDELVKGVRAAYEGRSVLAPSVAERLMGLVSAPKDKGSELSPRELDILRLVAGGDTNRVVAQKLFISEATVKTHLLHLYDKLGARDRASAVSIAYQRELLR